MPECKIAYRTNPLFKEVLDLTRPEFLIVRQVAGEAYNVLTPPSASGTQFVAATARNPGEARTFATIGAAVQYALDISALKQLRFELLNANSPDARDL